MYPEEVERETTHQPYSKLVGPTAAGIALGCVILLQLAHVTDFWAIRDIGTSIPAAI